MNRFLLISIVVLITLSVVGFFSVEGYTLRDNAWKLLVVAEDVGIIMMLINGTFIRSKYSRAALFFIMLIVVGICFKIMHLPGASEILAFSYISLWLIYFIYFIRKNEKKILDVLKVLTLLVFLTLPPMSILHLFSEEIYDALFITSHIVFIITFAAFVKIGFDAKTLFNK